MSRSTSKTSIGNGLRVAQGNAIAQAADGRCKGELLPALLACPIGRLEEVIHVGSASEMRDAVEAALQQTVHADGGGRRLAGGKNVPIKRSKKTPSRTSPKLAG